jgi:general secretion pathway protein G
MNDLLHSRSRFCCQRDGNSIPRSLQKAASAHATTQFRPRPRRVRVRGHGFTLIELLVVLAIVALLLTLAMPRYSLRVDTAKETILVDTLRNMRAVADQYQADTGRYPDSLQQLVEKKYLDGVPIDPITGSRDTWIVVPPADSAQGGVYDLHSGAPGLGRNGHPYREW